jgi:plasmid stabilization system protein ParE
MARRNWTREAETWLRDIFAYIAQDNPAAAARVVAGIYERAQVLSEFPQIGHR